jgi:hypothetical protein
MNIPPDDLTEQLLHADGQRHRDAYIDDAGFTQRVITALPTKQPTTLPTAQSPVTPLSPALRWVLTYGMALVATIGVTFFAGGANFMIDAFMDMATSTATSASVGFGLTFAVISAAALFAMVQQT